MRRGLTLTAFDIDILIDDPDRKLFRQATQPGHSLHHLSPLNPPHTDLTSFIRGNIHISFPLFNICSLKIVISIVVYLSMYNLPLVMSRCLALVLTFSCFSLCISSYSVSCFVYYIFLVFYLYSSCNNVRMSH